jgi:hypothetical protein
LKWLPPGEGGAKKKEGREDAIENDDLSRTLWLTEAEWLPQPALPCPSQTQGFWDYCR